MTKINKGQDHKTELIRLRKMLDENCRLKKGLEQLRKAKIGEVLDYFKDGSGLTFKDQVLLTDEVGRLREQVKKLNESRKNLVRMETKASENFHGACHEVDRLEAEVRTLKTAVAAAEQMRLWGNK